MRMKKTVIGLVSACVILGASASAIYASENKEQMNLIDSIETFEPGTMEENVEGVQMNKEIIDENISTEIEVLEDGAMNEDLEGKEMLTKEIIEE